MMGKEQPEKEAAGDFLPNLPDQRLKVLVQIQQRMLRPIIWDDEGDEILGIIATTVGAEGAVLWRRRLRVPEMVVTRQGCWGCEGGKEEIEIEENSPGFLSLGSEELWFDTGGAVDELGLLGAKTGGGGLIVPLRGRDELFGILAMQIADREAFVQGGGLEFLRVVAVSLAMALERSHYHRELKESQARLRQSQKMEAVGQFAGGIAHDFNNLLTVIRGYTVLLRDQLPKNSASSQMNDEVAKAADRASALTRQLLTFARRRKLELKLVDLNEVVRGIQPMLSRLLGETVHLETILSAGQLPARADANLIEQSLFNLVANARDAMPEGGVLKIKTLIRKFRKGQAGLPKGQEPQAYSCIEIKDTGEGIPDEARDHIFEPFFTTKPVGKGTGLGLATVYAILQQHRGWIDVESETGKGTTIRLFLPFQEIKETKPESHNPAAVAVAPAAQGETILLVEDDDAVLRLSKLVLEHAGYRVVVARSGPEGIKVWGEQKGRIDLLMTDIVMPEKMSGIELAERLTAEKPDLSVVLVSGYSPDLDRIDDRNGRMRFLQKPFEAAVLTATIRALLDSRLAPDPEKE